MIHNLLHKMSGSGSHDTSGSDDSLYPIAVLIDELRNEDVQVGAARTIFSWLARVREAVWF